MIAVFLATVCLGTAALTGVVRREALRRRRLDIPNARSSHTEPTPRGGGIAVVVSVSVGLTLIWIFGWASAWVLVGLLLGGALVAGVGHVDDAGHVAPAWRLLVHVSAAAVAVACAIRVQPVPLFGLEIVPAALVIGTAVLFLVWNLNLFNFMDGIDGLAGAQATTVCLGMALLLWFLGEPGFATVASIYGFASLGFLTWNWPPARIFMGDSGSGFLGFSIASLAIFVSAATAFPIWSWLILMGVFIVDATMTLARRIARAERWYEAHRTHAYQWAVRRHGGHRPVTLAILVINLIWLLPLAWLAVRLPSWGGALLVVAWLPLVVLGVRYGAGTPESGVGPASIQNDIPGRASVQSG